MTFEQIPLADAAGRVLATQVLRASGQKILPKGRRLNQDDLTLLANAQIGQIWVTRLAEDEMEEDEATRLLAPLAVGGAVHVEANGGGKVLYFVNGRVAVLVDRRRLEDFNASGAAVLATAPAWSVPEFGTQAAFLKTRPLAIPRATVEHWVWNLREQGPLVTLAPFQRRRVSVIYCDPVNPHRALDLLSGAVVERARQYDFSVDTHCVLEEPEILGRAIREQAAAGHQLVILATTSSPAVPEDVLGAAYREAGATLESFMAPVDPGALLFLGYASGTPVIAVPGCLRSRGPDVFDRILPALLAGYRLTAADIASLGPGGLSGAPARRLIGVMTA